MSRWTVLFSSVIPASGTRQIEKTFIKGLLTIQVQELRKSHNKPKLRQQYRKSHFSGDKNGSFDCQFSTTLKPPYWMFSRISEFQVAPTPISSRFLCPSPPLLLSAPNQNRHKCYALLRRLELLKLRLKSALKSARIGNSQLRTQACSRYPSDQRSPRRIFPTSLTGDVTSEIAEDDWE